MKFIVDNQLPIALARFLASRGCDCQHVAEIGLERASDAEIWRFATTHGGVVIGKDEDFLYFANRPQTKARFLWIRLGNCRTHALLAAINSLWSRIEKSLEAGERVVEIR